MAADTPGAGQKAGIQAKKAPGTPADRHRFPASWPGAAGILFLLFAVIPTLPSEYFTALRYLVCGLSAVMIVLAWYCRRWAWIAPFLLLAAVFNPIHWPGFGVKYWQLADVAGALLFLVGAYFIYPKRKAPEKAPAAQAAGEQS